MPAIPVSLGVSGVVERPFLGDLGGGVMSEISKSLGLLGVARRPSTSSLDLPF